MICKIYVYLFKFMSGSSIITMITRSRSEEGEGKLSCVTIYAIFIVRMY